jgi:Deoxynucleotide monophosphate kinase
MESTSISLIGLSGRIGSGKNTAATIFQLIDYYKSMPEGKSITLDFFIKKVLSSDDHFINYCTSKSSWIQKSYADKLKQVCSILSGIPIEKFSDQSFKASFMPHEWVQSGPMQDDFLMTVRQFIQRVATEAIRNNVHYNTWVNALFADYIPYNGYRPPGMIKPVLVYPKWLITDVRFPNEYSAIKKRGGIIIRMERDFQHKSDHVSETALDEHQFDFIVDNNGSISDLVNSIIEIFNQIT